ncbi:hypothetical protein BT93_B2660 [Corymbia citriodora subsp. variegata]|nr:hypothetical protein BT93_B2660 [Corymbia citriodora subsp. variegata]
MVSSRRLFQYFRQCPVSNCQWPRSITNFCRCGSSGRMRHTNRLVCSSTLRYPQGWILVCSCGCAMAFLHQCHWLIQYLTLESSCIPSTVSILHVQVFEENSTGRLDVPWWDFVVYNWFRSYVCRSWTLFSTVNSEKLRWPVLGIAILAAVVGSQAIITGTFSIIKQCSALGCFPRVKIVHTSSKIHGQIYIPEINWILMVLCLAVTIGFRDTKSLGNASGLAVITVMLVTTCLMSLVIVLCWHQSVVVAIAFVFFFGTIEALYFSASLVKFLEGAWVPIALAFIFLIVMCVWHYGTLKTYEYDDQNKVSINWLMSLGPSLGIVRVRGIGLIHTELVSGIPAIFSHFVTNLPAFHQVLVFLCVKSVTVPHVRPEERFLVGHIGPREFRLYRCVVRYGYRDVHKDDLEFENDLVCSIAEFIRTGGAGPGSANEDNLKNEDRMTVVGTSATHADGIQMSEDDVDDVGLAGSSTREIQSPQLIKPRKKRVRFIVPESPKIDVEARNELRELTEAREAGVAYILGHSYVRAKQGSSFLRKMVINIGYDFLRRNCRAPINVLSAPHATTLEVGMVYPI